jgi:hypothetical protein
MQALGVEQFKLKADQYVKAPAATAMAIVLLLAMPTEAKQWFVLNASEGRCLDGAAAGRDTARSGLPPITSPYEFTQELGRQHDPFTTRVTRDARGEITAVIIISGSTSVYWFPSRVLCEGFRDWARANGSLVSPSELK